MIKYLIDKNTFSKRIISEAKDRNDICVLMDVLEESGYSKNDAVRFRTLGLQILHVSKRHLEMLKIIMKEQGNNHRLIDLHAGKGAADVVMLAYVLAEKKHSVTLFQDEFILVTKDKELIRVAVSYDISCVPDIAEW